MRVASRFLLPLELFLGIKLLILAVNGGLAHGLMYRALAQAGENLSWLLFVGSIGITLCVISLYEWFFLRDAPPAMIYKSVSARAVCAFMGTMTWLATAITMISLNAAPNTMYFMLLAPVAGFFHAWCFVENMKVRLALDDRYPTPNLRFHR